MGQSTRSNAEPHLGDAEATDFCFDQPPDEMAKRDEQQSEGENRRLAFPDGLPPA